MPVILLGSTVLDITAFTVFRDSNLELALLCLDINTTHSEVIDNGTMFYHCTEPKIRLTMKKPTQKATDRQFHDHLQLSHHDFSYMSTANVASPNWDVL